MVPLKTYPASVEGGDVYIEHDGITPVTVIS